MSPVTKSPFDGADSPLRPVSLNPSHYRSGRWVLLGEGVLVAALGGWGLLAGVSYPAVTGAGLAAAMLAAASTPAHSALLLGFGVAAVLATARRRTALIVTGLGVGGFLLLFAIGTVAAARGAPGVLGFNLSESVLHAVLLAVNMALFIWFVANALEGPAWVRRPRPGVDGADGSDGPVAP